VAGTTPLVRGEDVALIGRRDEGQSYGHEALAVSGILDLTWTAIAPDGAVLQPTALAETAATVLGRVAANDLSGFWIHVDADVLNPEVMPAVGSPEPGGPDINELVALLAPLVDHPEALGIALSLYDPSLDPDRSSGARLVDLLAKSVLSGAPGLRG
jgi:arginase